MENSIWLCAMIDDRDEYRIAHSEYMQDVKIYYDFFTMQCRLTFSNIIYSIYFNKIAIKL